MLQTLSFGPESLVLASPVWALTLLLHRAGINVEDAIGSGYQHTHMYVFCNSPSLSS